MYCDEKRQRRYSFAVKLYAVVASTFEEGIEGLAAPKNLVIGRGERGPCVSEMAPSQRRGEWEMDRNRRTEDYLQLISRPSE